MQLTKEIINVSWLDTTDGGVSSIDTSGWTLVVRVQSTQKWREFNRHKWWDGCHHCTMRHPISEVRTL